MCKLETSQTINLENGDDWDLMKKQINKLENKILL